MAEEKSPKSPTGNQAIHFAGEVIALSLDLRDLIVELSRLTDNPEETELLQQMLEKAKRLRELGLGHQEWAKQPRKKRGK
ncbi:MAG: hypothetical protein KJ077_10320 [Anaerolineae bacterium]|nr:hypothetical protein [Anaerolineae bacterium]